MTTKITITNEDGQKKFVRVKLMYVGYASERSSVYGPETTQPVTVNGAIVVKSGETQEFWLHSGQMLEVFEGSE